MTVKTSREHSLQVLRELRKAGCQAYWAGGCVRDMLLGRDPKDYDVATNATPDQVQALFPRTLDVGKAYGVIHVWADDISCEVTTFRRDLAYRDGRHPEAVEFCEAREDAQRRDFTVNGLFYDPDEDAVIDYVNGRADLERRTLRAIGTPADRFQEDYLRMLRAVRFASTLAFGIEDQTADAIRNLAGHITMVSAERIQQELTHLLLESPRRAGRGLRQLHELGLLAPLLPEVAAMVGQEQPPAYHPEGDVFTHTLMMLDAMETPDLRLAYSVLFHDIGKPLTALNTLEPDGTYRIRFNNHANVGADLAVNIMERLKLPGRETEDVAYCVRNHMRFMDVQNMRRATLRRLVGAPTFATELELHRLDCLCSHGDLGNYDFLRRVMEELSQEPVLPEPWVSGHDIMALGIPEGPEVGHWHRLAYDRQLEGTDPSREELMNWLREAVSQAD